MSVAELLPCRVVARPMRAPSLETVGMTKIFGPLVALDDVSIKVEAGEVHALLGENGAGKSTLVKCIMGFYSPDEAPVLLDGAEVVIRNPRDARALGIGMVYQHFTLVPSLTGAENLVISRADAPAVIDWKKEKRALEAFLDRMPFRVPLDVPVSDAGRRREAEARNPQAALSRPAPAHPRRADLGADAGRSRRNAGPAARHGRSARKSRSS